MSHITAAVSLITPLGYPVFEVWADVQAEQYVIVGYQPHGLDPETTPGGDVGFEATLRILARAATAEGVSIMLRRVRQALGLTRVADDAGATTFVFARPEFVEVDPETVDPATNRHPFYGVDTYLARWEPV